MKILMLLHGSYPAGMAMTNRLHLHAKGLREAGAEAEVLIIAPTEKPGKMRNQQVAGTFEGVPFRYAWHTTQRSANFFGRRWHDFAAGIKTLLYVRQMKPAYVIVTGHFISLMLFLRMVTWWIRIPLLKVENEVPYFHLPALAWRQKLRLRLFYKLLDGVVVITDELRNFFQPLLRKNAHILYLPILVDTELYQKGNLNSNRVLFYAGTLTQHKDGILDLLEAFGRIKDQVPDCTMELTGNIEESPDKDAIRKILARYELNNRVRFLGYLSVEDLRTKMKTAVALLLAKPPTRQAQYCFPTKLGEYLSTGNPVLTTKVGPGSRFFHDGTNAYVSSPEEGVAGVAKRMLAILLDQEAAFKVGEQGKLLAKQEFDYRAQTQRHLKELTAAVKSC